MLTSSLDSLLTLRPLCEQQQDLDTAQEAMPAPPSLNSMRKEVREGEKEGHGTEARETFGSGMVSVTEASDSDRLLPCQCSLVIMILSTL